jgi:hypothetical protein
VRWPQFAVATFLVAVYAVVVWIKANDLRSSTPRALGEISVTGALLLVLTLALREGGFW